MNGEKILTLIVPSYNMEKYLSRCCESVVLDDADLMARLEVLIVNDGSKDRTSEIGHEYESRYPGVFRVIDKENGHYGSCVNVGLKASRGKFVKLLDADDTFDRSMFAIYLEHLLDKESWLDENQVDIVMSDFCDYDGNDVVYRTVVMDLKPETVIPVDNIAKAKEKMLAARIAYRKSMLETMNYIQSEKILYTDTEWAFYPVLKASNYVYYPIVLYRYFHGRAEQSTNFAVYAHNLNMLEDVLSRMMREVKFPELSLSRQQLARNVIWNVASMLFNIAFYGASIDEVNKWVGRCDGLLKADAELYQLGESVQASRRLRYKFVSEFRRTGRIPLLRIAGIRYLSKLRRIGGCLGKKLAMKNRVAGFVGPAREKY